MRVFVIHVSHIMMILNHKQFNYMRDVVFVIIIGPNIKSNPNYFLTVKNLI